MRSVLIALFAVTAGGVAGRADDIQVVPMLSNAETWERLPPATAGSGQPLPPWARALAGPLPKTTAALLPLDFVHRTGGPLDPKLRAALRWAVADLNKSAYGKATAEADARRAGLTDVARGGGRTPADTLALQFARDMTANPSGVTDAQFAELVKAFDQKKAAAMVLLTAYANFQDRLFACLGTTGEPLPPLEVVFAPGGLATETTPAPTPPKPALPKPDGSGKIAGADAWAAEGYDALQKKLADQKGRATRLPVPTREQVAAGLPAGYKTALGVVWNRVVLGYAPELAMPWETVLRTSGGEQSGKVDRLFNISLFWVTTKAIDCPYCMGHCEMNWEVAGLTPPDIAERSKSLASGDWSSFPPAQRRAFAFARKLTETPAAVGPSDVAGLVTDFGPGQAAVLAFQAARNNYMTRISNGFQLTLEKDNVFFEYYGLTPPAKPGR